MMHLSSRSKIFLALVAVALTVFFSRHYIFATTLEMLIGKIDYLERKWEEGSLTYTNVAWGDMKAPEVKCSPTFSLFPLHLSMGIYITEPHFALSNDSAPTFNLALLIPTRWSTIKLDIEKGSLSINDESLGGLDFVSSESTDAIGTLILSENEKSSYCTCEVMRRGYGLYYKIHFEEAPVLYMQAFATLFTDDIPFKLEGGKIDADLQGVFPSVEGSVKGKGLAFKKGSCAFDQTEAFVSFYLEKPPQLNLKGQLFLGQLQGPFLCSASGDSIVEGKFQFAGWDVPFQLYYQNSEAMVHAELTSVPLIGFGVASASVTAKIKNYQLDELSVNELMLSDVKHLETIQGEIECKGPFEALSGVFSASTPLYQTEAQGTFRVQKDALTWEGDFSVLTDEVKAQGVINYSQKTWSAEFQSPSIVLSNFTDEFPEGSIAVKGVASPQEIRAICIGKDLLYQNADKVLQIPGKTSPIEVVWSGGQLTLHTMLSPSTLYLKSFSTPIYLEGGELFWKEEKLAIQHLQACLDEIVFQGELYYAATPKPHLQLKAHSVEGPIQNLSMFDPRIKGWEGYFRCRSGGFFLDTDLVAPPRFQIQASIEELSHRFSKEVALIQGKLNLAFESSSAAFQCSEMTGKMRVGTQELSLIAPTFSGVEGKYQFDIQCPDQNIHLVGHIENDTAQFTELQLGHSRITTPLQCCHFNTAWHVKGGADLDLKSLPDYLLLAQQAGYLKDITLPWMEGKLRVSGWATETKATVDILSERIKVGELTFPAFSGHLVRENHRFQTENFKVGNALISGSALYENQGWHIPAWTMRYIDFDLSGSAKLLQNICCIDLKGLWKNQFAIDGALEWNLQTRQGRNCRVDIACDATKITLRAADMQWKDDKMTIPSLQTTLFHKQLKDPIITQLSISGTPERTVFQGPLSQGSYENPWFLIKGKEIQGMYEKGILHFQSKLFLQNKPIQAKGHFFALEGGRGVVNISDGDERLHLSFATFSEVNKIEGNFLGIDCSFVKKGLSYDGRVWIKTSDHMAELFKKPEWTQFQNINLQGIFSTSNCRGTISGKNVVIKGYMLDHFSASLDYIPTRMEIKQIKIEDPAGKLFIKECLGTRSHPLKAWEIVIPQIRGQLLEPSLLRRQGAPVKERKPFKVRQLTLENIRGIVGRPLTFTGYGSFYFTQKEKRDVSLFDLPRAFLKDWGLDVALLSPTRGSAQIELKQGKMFFTDLKDTFSDGDHSEFYLSENEPSYIDFNGNLFLNLRMKQYVAIKLVEPFTLSVRGTWEKPHYTLR